MLNGLLCLILNGCAFRMSGTNFYDGEKMARVCEIGQRQYSITASVFGLWVGRVWEVSKLFICEYLLYSYDRSGQALLVMAWLSLCQ